MSRCYASQRARRVQWGSNIGISDIVCGRGRFAAECSPLSRLHVSSPQSLAPVPMLPAGLGGILGELGVRLTGDEHCSMDMGVVDIAELGAGMPLRSTGLDAAHVASLAAAEWPMRPILVHRPTMQVIDGHHRVAAAVGNGMDSIQANLFDGPLGVAIILALRANVSHGLPLSLADRKAAAQQLLECHGEWSDRSISVSAGLSAKVIAKLRCASEDGQQLHGRIGRDGRRRPLNAAAKRVWAAEVLSSQPGVSLRQVGRAVGLSPGTVRDVLARVQRGEDPVPGRTAAGDSQSYVRSGEGSPTSSVEPTRGTDAPAQDPAQRSSSDGRVEATLVLAKLTRDPALRLSEVGRDLLRRLHSHVVTVEDSVTIAEVSPDRSVEHLLGFAQACAEQWASIAEQLVVRRGQIHDQTAPVVDEGVETPA